jgi:hypothetical protein
MLYLPVKKQLHHFNNEKHFAVNSIKTRKSTAEKFRAPRADVGTDVRFEQSAAPLALPTFLTRLTLAQLFTEHPEKFAEFRLLLNNRRGQTK